MKSSHRLDITRACNQRRLSCAGEIEVVLTAPFTHGIHIVWLRLTAGSQWQASLGGAISRVLLMLRASQCASGLRLELSVGTITGHRQSSN